LIAGSANANLLVNGDFEDPGGSGWTQWWGGNSHKYVPDPIQADNCAGVWWFDDGMFQDVVLTPGTYTVSGDLLNFSGDGAPLSGGRIGVIQAEISDGSDPLNPWWVLQIIIDESDSIDTWKSGSTIIDNTTAGATFMRVNLFLINTLGPDGFGNCHFDNISVVPEPATMVLLGLGALMLRRRK